MSAASAGDAAAVLGALPECDLFCLSPHFDDAVLSCGGVLAQAARAGSTVVVVTIFAGEPEDSALRRPHVIAAHGRWGLEGGTAVSRRRAEDLAALAVVGAHAAWIPLVDHLYWPHAGAWAEPEGWRRWAARLKLLLRPARRRAQGERRRMVEAVVRACVARWPAATVLAPLGLGGHPDHRLVAAAARTVVPPTLLACYEDLPYAARADGVGREALGGLELRPVAIASTLVAKQRALACYSSQLDDLVGGAAQASAAVAAWAGSDVVERLWRPARVPPRAFVG
jgi:LmbE family N-acetylglucosaminyl deacetylase